MYVCEIRYWRFFFMWARLLAAALVFICFSFYGVNSYAAVVGANKAAATLCDVILLLGGRATRALCIFTIIFVGFKFLTGSITWQKALTTSVGIVLIFGAESFAHVILPSTMKGISGMTANGKVFQRDKEYSPAELVSGVCPELSRFG